jgi:iron complex outermembrane receptor protein
MKSKILIFFALLVQSAAGFARDTMAQDTAATHRLDEVVVTGSNHAVGRNLLPYTVSTMSAQELEATGTTQLLSALSGRVPGLFVSERNSLGFGVSNGGSGGIKIRGVGGSPTNAILMMVDGQPQFAGIYSHHVADFYHTQNVEHVEVLRGPASVLYGSNAMGGVINVITRGVEQEGVHTTLTSQYGSHNTWQSALTNTIRKGRFSSLVSLSYDRTDGVQKNFDFKETDLYAKVGYELSRHWQATADYSLMHFVGNDPIYPKVAKKDSTSIYHQNITRGESSLMFTNRYGNTNGSARVYYSYGNHYIDDPNHFHSVDDRFGVLLYQNFRPWTGAAATVGFDFDTYTGKIPASGGVTYGDGSQKAKMQTMARKSITEYSPYITLSQEFWGGRLVLNGGLRMANSDKFGTQWVPQGGFVVRPGAGWMLKASAARGYRNPSFKEMYLYAMANPELDPERMSNYEVSVGKQLSRILSVELTGFYCEGSNLIQTVQAKNVNTGAFRNKGIEVALTARPTETVALHASYSYLHTSLTNLTAAPGNQCYLGVTWTALPTLIVDAGVRNVGKLYVSTDKRSEEYALLQAKVTYKVLPSLSLFVNLDNITDTRYEINEGYRMPGFTAAGGFKWTF